MPTKQTVACLSVIIYLQVESLCPQPVRECVSRRLLPPPDEGGARGWNAAPEANNRDHHRPLDEPDRLSSRYCEQEPGGNLRHGVPGDCWRLVAHVSPKHGAAAADLVCSSLPTNCLSCPQERFLPPGETDDPFRTWWVPLTHTSQGSPDFNDTRVKAWLKDTETQTWLPHLPAKDQWVIFNVQQTGFYRVNYDQHNWELLIRQMLTDHQRIHVKNRVQMIDDIMSLASTGEVTLKNLVH